MPNHCSNIMRVKGPKAALEEFRKFARGKEPAWDGKVTDKESDLCLNQFVPVPPKVLNARKDNYSDAFNSGGYEWCCSNWGTKWGAYDTQVEMLPDCLEYRFLTAWNPFSIKVLKAMAAKFPTLMFELKYGEAGEGFGGTMVASDGEAEEDAYFKNAGKIAKRDADFKYLMDTSG